MKPIYQTALVVFLAVISFSVHSGAAAWYKLENSHFIMYSTASEKTSRELFTELEGFRSLVLNFINFKIPADAEKVKILMFSNVGDFKKYTWSNDIAGFVVPTENSAIIVQPAWIYGMSPTNIIYHEFVHTLLRHYPKKLPGWFQEGLAELFGATEYRMGKFYVGVAPKDRLKAASYEFRFASFDDIVADKFRTHRSGYAEDPYVQYWMLAHYLEFGSKKRKKDLQFYLLLYSDGMDSLKAFQAAFKESPEELWHKELKRYFRRGRIPGLRVEVPPESSDNKVAYSAADIQEVQDTLIPIGLNSANAAEYRKDYRRSYNLLKYLKDNTDPHNKRFISIINNYVWLLSTCPNKWIRDGEEAVRLGEDYIRDKTDNIAYLDTLAAAYAEANNFDEAIRLESNLIARLEKKHIDNSEFTERLTDYKNHKPWRRKEK